MGTPITCIARYRNSSVVMLSQVRLHFRIFFISVHRLLHGLCIVDCWCQLHCSAADLPNLPSNVKYYICMVKIPIVVLLLIWILENKYNCCEFQFCMWLRWFPTQYVTLTRSYLCSTRYAFKWQYMMRMRLITVPFTMAPHACSHARTSCHTQNSAYATCNVIYSLKITIQHAVLGPVLLLFY